MFSFPPKASLFGSVFFKGLLSDLKQKSQDVFLTEHWTERMPSNATNLQWTMSLGDEISSCRGNEALARQRDRPSWLRTGLMVKPGFGRLLVILYALGLTKGLFKIY